MTNHTPSSIAWIGSFQLMMPFAMGIISGKLFDKGHFHLVQIAGGVIFIFSFVFPNVFWNDLLTSSKTIHAVASQTFPILPGNLFFALELDFRCLGFIVDIPFSRPGNGSWYRSHLRPLLRNKLPSLRQAAGPCNRRRTHRGFSWLYDFPNQ